MNVFTYGSLMYDSVWSRVITRTYRQKSGEVDGFQRLQVRNERYPALISGNDVVDGVVYFDLTAQDVALLDRFEGEFYQREEVEVVCEDGQRVPASVYVIRDEFTWVLNGPWSRVEFERAGLADFEEKYAGFTRRDR